jgi:hypothetical protein
MHETHPAIGTSVTVEARQTPTGWALERLVYAPVGSAKGHTITFNFTPGEAGASKFEVVAGKKKHLASGDVTMTAEGGEFWVLTQPVWAHRDPVVASATQTRGAAATQTASQAPTPDASQTH